MSVNLKLHKLSEKKPEHNQNILTVSYTYDTFFLHQTTFKYGWKQVPGDLKDKTIVHKLEEFNIGDAPRKGYELVMIFGTRVLTNEYDCYWTSGNKSDFPKENRSE